MDRLVDLTEEKGREGREGREEGKMSLPESDKNQQYSELELE